MTASAPAVDRPVRARGPAVERTRAAVTNSDVQDDAVQDVAEWDLSPEEVAALAATMVGVARRQYRLKPFDAEDAAQEAFVTFLQIRNRYPRTAEHPAILVGILKKKCLEHIGAVARDNRRLARYCAKPDAARENAWIRPRLAGTAPSAIDDVVRAEARALTLDAIRNLKPAARKLTRLITWHDFDRKELIERLELNKNTLDSRLRACRTQLRHLLDRRGLSA